MLALPRPLRGYVHGLETGFAHSRSRCCSRPRRVQAQPGGCRTRPEVWRGDSSSAPRSRSLLVVAAAGAAWYYSSLSSSPWEVTRLDGAPRIGSQSVIQTATLGEGQWLETDGESRAQVNVGAIGEVEVGPNSRVQLVEASLTEHRLSLERGRLQATIWAPPRLFFVDTPSAEAIDSGCAYTIEVDDAHEMPATCDIGLGRAAP